MAACGFPHNDKVGLRFQQSPDAPPEEGVVIYHEHLQPVHILPLLFLGTATTTLVPWPRSLSTVILPPKLWARSLMI